MMLGSQLYCIYVNGINHYNSNILPFPDDTTMFLSHSDIKPLYDEAYQQINQPCEWFRLTNCH